MNAFIKTVAVPAINFRRLLSFSIKNIALKKPVWKKQDFQKVDQAKRFQAQATADRLQHSPFL